MPVSFTTPPPTPRRTFRTPPTCAAAGANTNPTPANAPRPHGRAAPPDWRLFRAHLHAAERAHLPSFHHTHLVSPSPPVWAHRLPAVEPGALLLATQAHVWPRNFAHLDHAVVLVTDLTPAGVSGLLLNRPTAYTVGAHASVLGRVGAVFEPNVVHLGGDCSTGSLEVLHGVPDVAGGEEVVPGLYRGGFNAARALVKEGAARADEFHFFVAYSRWTWEQFRAEVDAGAWMVAAVAPELVLGEYLESAKERPRRVWERFNGML